MEGRVYLLFVALAVVRGGCAQDLDGLVDRFQASKAAQDALQDSASDTKELEGLMRSMDRIWTEEFPQLVQQGLFSNFTQGCMESALSVYETGGTMTFNNFTLFPGPKLIPILDATGKPGAGLLSGNVVLNGAYDECFSYNYTGFCLAQQVFTSVIKSPLPFTVGFCVPKNCTARDMALLINSVSILETSEEAIQCSDTKDPSYSAGAIVMVFICSVFVALVIVGTLIDCVLTNLLNFLRDDDKVDDNNPSINNEGSSESAPLLGNSTSVVKRAEFRAENEKINPLEFITAFSLFKTVPTLLATKQAPGVITSLNGLRVISMFWVILGHTHFWAFNGSVRIDNFSSLLTVGKRFTFQAVVSGFFSVDSFFFLSGVLVAYLTLRQMKRGKGRFPFLKYYIHRILRLTPTYAFVLFFAWFLTVHLAHGPTFSLSDPFAANCKKYWWTNFLYINNLYPWSLMDGCISWTWYLANDMQFYVISPLILIPAYFLFPVGLAVAAAFVVSGFIITGGLTSVYDFQANTFSLIAYGYVGHGTETISYSNAIYIKPWDRIAPYVVGLILGYILYRGINFDKLKLPRIVKLILHSAMWFVAGFVMLWLVYGLYFTWNGHTPMRFENFIYITTSRFLWAVGLALIVFSCHNGYGWFINSFLSMGIWTPLSRMTFNAYLVHPIIMTVVYGQLQMSLHYTDITMAGFAVIFVVFSYGAAAIVCVFVEFPLSTIEMLLFKIFGTIRCKTKKQKYVNLNGSAQKEVKT